MYTRGGKNLASRFCWALLVQEYVVTSVSKNDWTCQKYCPIIPEPTAPQTTTTTRKTTRTIRTTTKHRKRTTTIKSTTDVDHDKNNDNGDDIMTKGPTELRWWNFRLFVFVCCTRSRSFRPFSSLSQSASSLYDDHRFLFICMIVIFLLSRLMHALDCTI